MYYRLTDKYALRGWEQTTCALVLRETNDARAVEPRAFNLLMLSNGETDLGVYPFSDAEKKLLEKYLAEGVLEAMDAPRPLDPDQRYRFYKNRYVSTVFWSMTGRCNYKCRHCFMDAPDGALGEISHEEAVSLIEQMDECGIKNIDLTGGEPFVRRDFWELIDLMLEKGIRVGSVYTNGLLLTDACLDKFEERGMKPVFSISFDGLGWHDWLRGREGAEKAALGALERCIARGFRVNVEMCVHRGNLSTFRDTIRRLAEIGVPAIKVSAISDTPLWLENGGENRLPLGDYLDAMIDYIPQYFEDDLPVHVLLCNVAGLSTKDEPLFTVVPEKYSGDERCLDSLLCGAMRTACYISPEGRMLPCMPFTALEDQSGFERFQDIGLRAGLSGSFYHEFVDKRVKDIFAENEKCASCPYRLRCGGGCRACAICATGDLMGADLDQCFIWENGYADKIRAACEAAAENYKKRKASEHEN